MGVHDPKSQRGMIERRTGIKAAFRAAHAEIEGDSATRDENLKALQPQSPHEVYRSNHQFQRLAMKELKEENPSFEKLGRDVMVAPDDQERAMIALLNHDDPAVRLAAAKLNMEVYKAALAAMKSRKEAPQQNTQVNVITRGGVALGPSRVADEFREKESRKAPLEEDRATPSSSPEDRRVDVSREE